MMQLHILSGFQTTRGAPLPPSAVWRTIIQYKALSRLQQAQASPRQPLIHPPPPPNTHPTPRRLSLSCNARWDRISKSLMQLVMLSAAMVEAMCWSMLPQCSCALACWQVVPSGVQDDRHLLLQFSCTEISVDFIKYMQLLD